MLTWPFRFLKSGRLSLPPNLQSASFYDLPSPKLIDGVEFPLPELRGKVVIITNTASKCGLTDNHYTQFVELYDKYKERGFEILGFPCAQFSQEHVQVCNIKDRASRAKIKFPLMEVTECNGDKSSYIFQWLKLKSGCFGNSESSLKNIGWNFGKFLLSREGNVLGYYGPRTDPKEMTPDIEKALEQALEQ